MSLKPRSWFSFFGVCAPLKGTMKGSVATAATARSILRINRTVTQTSVRQRKSKHQIARRPANARQVGSPAGLRVDAMARRAIEAEVSFPDVDGCRGAGERIGLGAKKSGEKDGRKKQQQYGPQEKRLCPTAPPLSSASRLTTP